MSWLLAVETSTPSGGIALFNDEHMVDIFHFEKKQPASETLIPSINVMLKKQALKPSDLSRFAVSIGPGSFTGLRVGLTAVKTMAMFLEKPVTTVSTLRALAFAAGPREQIVGVVLDARKKEVFCGWFRVSDSVEAVSEERVEPVEQFLATSPDKNVYLIGTGIGEYSERIEKTGIPVEKAPESLWFPSPEFVGKVALTENCKTCSGDQIPGIVPVYIRRSEAEIHWKKKQSNTR